MPFLQNKTVPPGAEEFQGNDRYEGYAPDLAAILAKIIQIDYTIIPVKDAKYGSQDKDGSWNGMIGELIRGVEVTVQCIYINY